MSEVISVRIPSELKAAIKAKARISDQSMAEVVKEALEASLDEHQIASVRSDHERHMQAIEALVEASTRKANEIASELDKTEDRIKTWRKGLSSWTWKAGFFLILLCGLISAFSAVFILSMVM